MLPSVGFFSTASRWDSLFYAGQGSTLRVSTARIHVASPSLLLRSGLGAPAVILKPLYG